MAMGPGLIARLVSRVGWSGPIELAVGRPIHGCPARAPTQLRQASGSAFESSVELGLKGLSAMNWRVSTYLLSIQASICRCCADLAFEEDGPQGDGEPHGTRAGSPALRPVVGWATG